MSSRTIGPSPEQHLVGSQTAPPPRAASVCAVLAIMLLVLAAATETHAADLDLRPRWNVGDKQVLSFERRREDSRNPGRTIVARYTVSIEVLRASPRGYQTRWTFGPATVEGSAAEERQFLQEVMNVVAGLQCDLQIEANGTVARLLNWKAVKTTVDAAVARMMDRLRQAGVPPPVLAYFRQYVDAFASEESVRTHGLREIALYHAVFGSRYSLGAPERYEATLESPLGREPIPSRGHIVLRRLDAAAGLAHIDWTHTTDPEAASRLSAKAITELALRMGRPAPSARDVPRLEVEEVSEYVVDLWGSWVKSVKNTRTIKSSTATETALRVDTLIVTETGP